MIPKARTRQLIVFTVKIVSLIKRDVIIAKMIVPTPKPISFPAQSSPVSCMIFLIAYQKHKPVGIANKNTVKKG